MARMFVACAIACIVLAGRPAAAAEGKSAEDSPKGWCYGFGMGVAPYVYESHGGTGHSGSGIALRLALGYGFTKRDGVLIEVHNAFGMHRSHGRILASTQVWRGASWTHHYGLDKRPYFTMVGLGVLLKADESGKWNGYCPGVHVGAGRYAFPHLSASVHGLFGLDHQGGHSNRHAAITFLVTLMGY